MDPNNRGPEEYGQDGDHQAPRPRPHRDPITSDFGQHAPALARTVQLVSGDFLLTVNPVDGSEIEVCPPAERPARPEKLTAAERADAERAARPPVPPGPVRTVLGLLAREDERERLVRLLARGRSVRLTGPAGSGRTSLLDVVAEDCAGLAPDGVVRLNGHHRTADDLLHDLFYAVHGAPLHRPDRTELLGHLREAGTGNIVNCGAAMYMAPVGLVNAAHPAAAYAEALDVAGAHQSSYGREAAGVFAAAVAAACAPGATPDSVVAACLALAKDGTRAAIEAVCEVAARHSDFESALAPLRAAVAPYDTVGPDYRAPSLGARRPSRLHAIEELPVALGMLLVAGGDFRHAVLGAVNYGRDCDSIATMAGALAGALGSPVPEDWAKTVAEASRLDLWEPAAVLTAVAREVFARDVRRRRAHKEAFAAIGGVGCSG
ncbi:ADP-ribosylglycohydrolase family protein [Streptomyces violaceoruber]